MEDICDIERYINGEACALPECLEFLKEDEESLVPPPAKIPCTLDARGPRFIITHIDIEDFKSYAGQKVLGPFHKCFNAVVGPNGSGKSNVIDSMLFVFGYRASKIRSKKLSVLLHKSDAGGTAKSCTVAVHFSKIIDKDDHYEIIPNSNLTISRTAFYDNTSYYCMNGKKTNFKEIANVLREHGIDLDHNRFLILQGEVEQIAMMKPKAATEHETGMLEFIEDIIGTTRYKEPLKKLYALLERVNTERSEKLNRLKIVEKEKESLEKPMNEAVAYLEAENEITIQKNMLFHRLLLDEHNVLKETQESKKKLEETMDATNKMLKDTEKEELDRNERIEKIQSEYNAKIIEKDRIKAEFNSANTRDAGIQAEMSQLCKNRKKTKEQLSDEKKKLAEYEATPEKNEKEIEELKTLEVKLSKEQKTAETQRDNILSNIRSETQNLVDQKEQLQSQLISLQKEVSATKENYDMAKSSLDLYVGSEQKEKVKLDELKTNLDQCETSLRERQEELAKLHEQIPVLEAKLKDSKNEIEKLQREESGKSSELRIIRVKLEENRIAMQANRSKGRVLNFLLEQKQNGNIPGIYGRLGDLGAIDSKYDIAISTACGPLDNVVVDTVETAQSCIQALKDNDIGRATFIALDRQEHLRPYIKDKAETPENVPRLFDLIKVKENNLKTAFFYALRDTLVANDLSQATRIAYGQTRYRVVTLEGQVIELSGTMSGGGRTKLQGRMGNSVINTVTPAEQKYVEEKYNELQAIVTDLRQKRSAYDNILNELNTTLPILQMKSNKGSIEVLSLKEQMPVLKDQVERQKIKLQEASIDKNEMAKLTEICNSAKEEYDKAASAANVLEKQVKRIHDKIMDLSKGRIDEAQKKLDEIAKKMEKVRKEIIRLNVGIKTSLRNTKTTKERIVNMEAEIQDSDQRLTALKDEKSTIEITGTELLKKMDAIAEDVLDEESILQKEKDKIPDVIKKKTEIRCKLVELEQNMEEIDKSISDHEAHISQTERKISTLKIHEILGRSVPQLKEQYSEQELAIINFAELQYEITLQERSLSEKQPNLSVIKQYQEKRDIFIKRTSEVEEVTARRNRTRGILERVRQTRLSEFMDGYNIITQKLKEMYQMITLGGDAELELVDSLDPFSEGIVFSVRPPKKSWKNISNLSGGEKTLSSLALVFALHYYKPSPLFVMDEIDAALDFKNVSIVGHYIKERTKNAQFIIISLRSNMFELADHLIGIYKTNDCTKTIAICPARYRTMARRLQGDPAVQDQEPGEGTSNNSEAQNE